MQLAKRLVAQQSVGIEHSNLFAAFLLIVSPDMEKFIRRKKQNSKKFMLHKNYGHL